MRIFYGPFKSSNGGKLKENLRAVIHLGKERSRPFWPKRNISITSTAFSLFFNKFFLTFNFRIFLCFQNELMTHLRQNQEKRQNNVANERESVNCEKESNYEKYFNDIDKYSISSSKVEHKSEKCTDNSKHCVDQRYNINRLNSKKHV
jgi:hypothetical protein